MNSIKFSHDSYNKLRSQETIPKEAKLLQVFVVDRKELSECLMNTYQGTKRIITKSNAYFIMEVIDENTFLLKTIYERPNYLLDENSFGERHFSPKVVWSTDLCEGVN